MVQTNYFSKGDTSTYDRGGTHPVSNVFDFHNYTIDWTKESITWSVDGTDVRVLTYDAAKGGAGYPQTPMQVRLGSWVAGRPGSPQGTVDWAGGLANLDGEPSRAYYRRVSVTDYAGGVEGAKQYIYSDRSGTWESIIVDREGGGGDLENGGNDEDRDGDRRDGSLLFAAVVPSAGAISSPSSDVEDDTDGDADEDNRDGADDVDGDARGGYATDAPAHYEGERDREVARGAASLPAKAVTCVGVILSSVAIYVNLV